MCKQEPYGIMELGSLERLEGINEDMLFSHYKNILLKSRLDIFIVGNIDEQMVISQMKKITFGLEDNEEQLIQSIIIKEVSDIKKVVQKEQVNQAKLAMGFRTKTQASDADFCALMVCNAVFGGGPYSKLFNNVREKLSLAYYVYSRIDKFKGVMLVNSGIETDNYQIAFDSIMDQMEEVKNGRFSDDEIMAAKLGTINMIRSIGDSQRLMEDYYIGEIICNKKEDIDEFADSIMNINKEQIIEAAQKIQLDTIYFLTSQN